MSLDADLARWRAHFAADPELADRAAARALEAQAR